MPRCLLRGCATVVSLLVGDDLNIIASFGTSVGSSHLVSYANCHLVGGILIFTAFPVLVLLYHYIILSRCGICGYGQCFLIAQFQRFLVYSGRAHSNADLIAFTHNREIIGVNPPCSGRIAYRRPRWAIQNRRFIKGLRFIGTQGDAFNDDTHPAVFDLNALYGAVAGIFDNIGISDILTLSLIHI